MTTKSTISVCAVISVSIPQIFLLPTMTSFGHLILASSPVNFLIARQTPKPAAKVIPETSLGGSSGLNKNEK